MQNRRWLSYPPFKTSVSGNLTDEQPSPSGQVTGDAVDHNFHLLLGTGLNGRLADDYLIQRWATHLLQELLVDYRSNHPELKYRLLFRLGKATGYRALLLHSPEHPAVILQQLMAAATPQQAEKSRSDLLSQWRELAATPLHQRQLIAQLSHYQQPVGQAETEIDQLADIDPEQAIAAVRAALQSRAQFSILRPGQ